MRIENLSICDSYETWPIPPNFRYLDFDQRDLDLLESIDNSKKCKSYKDSDSDSNKNLFNRKWIKEKPVCLKYHYDLGNEDYSICDSYETWKFSEITLLISKYTTLLKLDNKILPLARKILNKYVMIYPLSLKSPKELAVASIFYAANKNGFKPYVDDYGDNISKTWDDWVNDYKDPEIGGNTLKFSTAIRSIGVSSSILAKIYLNMDEISIP